MKTLRLIYPQWQGGIINSFTPELKPEDANLGYSLGSQLLQFLAPENPNQATAVVPVSTANPLDRTVTDGISNWPEIKEQTEAALKILDEHNPERIITLGGECAVSVAPFAWLKKKYGPKTAIVWIDAHCDLNLPGDTYTGYHAMALAALLGKCPEQVTSLLPATFTSEQTQVVGLRDWDVGIQARQQEWGVKHVTSKELRQSPDTINQWLKTIGAEHVVIHFDMDALEPTDLFSAVAAVPHGVTAAEVVGLINRVDHEFNLVGLTIAEPMPRIAIKLRNMLHGIKLMQD